VKLAAAEIKRYLKDLVALLPLKAMDENISTRARQIYEKNETSGIFNGDTSNWLEAEKQLNNEYKERYQNVRRIFAINLGLSEEDSTKLWAQAERFRDQPNTNEFNDESFFLSRSPLGLKLRQKEAGKVSDLVITGLPSTYCFSLVEKLKSLPGTPFKVNPEDSEGLTVSLNLRSAARFAETTNRILWRAFLAVSGVFFLWLGEVLKEDSQNTPPHFKIVNSNVARYSSEVKFGDILRIHFKREVIGRQVQLFFIPRASESEQRFFGLTVSVPSAGFVDIPTTFSSDTGFEIYSYRVYQKLTPDPLAHLISEARNRLGLPAPEKKSPSPEEALAVGGIECLSRAARQDQFPSKSEAQDSLVKETKGGRLALNRQEASQDHYRVLGIRRGANIGEIKDAFKKGALATHPDRIPGKEEEFGLRGFIGSR
jgi:hypothetical protein